MKRKLILVLATILCISVTVPMIRAPARKADDWNSLWGYIDENDASLAGPASSMIAALDRVERLEEDLGIDLNTKSSVDLSPKDQAKLDRAISKALDRIDRFVVESGLGTGEKYIGETEKNLIVLLETRVFWLK